MALAERMGERILQSISHLGALEIARITNVEIGIRVANELELDAPIPGPTVGRWINGSNVPSLDTLAALARVLNVDPGWLVFGDLSGAPRLRDRVVEGAEPVGRESNEEAVDR